MDRGERMEIEIETVGIGVPGCGFVKEILIGILIIIAIGVTRHYEFSGHIPFKRRNEFHLPIVGIDHQLTNPVVAEIELLKRYGVVIRFENVFRDFEPGIRIDT